MADEAFEEDLVRRAQSGELSVAPFLVSVLGDRLLGYARGHAGNPSCRSSGIPNRLDLHRQDRVLFPAATGGTVVGITGWR